MEGETEGEDEGEFWVPGWSYPEMLQFLSEAMDELTFIEVPSMRQFLF